MRDSIHKPMLVIAIPTIGMHSFFFSQALIGCVYPSNFGMVSIWCPNLEVGRARNLLVQKAIDLQAKYLMFFDEDVIFPAFTVKRLVYLLENHLDWTIASGVYATKSYPPEPLIYKEWLEGPHWGWKMGDLIQVKATGMGCALLRVNDLAAMQNLREYDDRSPWDGLNMRVREWFNTGKNAEYQKDGSTDHTLWTEDMYFYRQFEKEGMKVFVDTSIQCRHYDSQRRLMFEVPLDSLVATKPDPWQHEPRVVDLGAGSGEGRPYWVTVDLRDDPTLTYRCDIRQLPQDWENQFDEARANHVLEHFDFSQTEDILKEWVRILKPGGKLSIHVPDMLFAAERILESEGEIHTLVQGMIYGDQGHEYWMQDAYGGEVGGQFKPESYGHNHHRSGFTAKTLGNLFYRLGLENIEGETSNGEIRIQGYKPAGKLQRDSRNPLTLVKPVYTREVTGAVQEPGSDAQVLRLGETGQTAQGDGQALGQRDAQPEAIAREEGFPPSYSAQVEEPEEPI